MKENDTFYIITFYFSFFVVLFIFFGILYISILYYKNNLRKVWLINILREINSFLIGPLFIPILSILLSILNCENGINYFNKKITCRNNLSTNIHFLYSIISSLLLILESLLVETIYFETQFSNNNPKAKYSSEVDILFFLSKILIILLFTFFNKKSNDWFLIMILFIISLFNLLIFLSMNPYYNKSIVKAYGILFSTFFWANAVLLWGKILEKRDFNGCIILFIIGIPIIIFLIITKDILFTGNVLFSINKLTNGNQAIKVIREILYLIDTKESKRSSKLILTSYINQAEEKCINNDCPIKKYLNTLKNSNIDVPVFLLQHCENIFQNYISKFPLEIKLRIFYSNFLMERLNKKKQASNELKNAENYPMSFEEEFILFRYKKILEEYNPKEGEEEGNLDAISNLEYSNYYKSFRNSIIKVSSLYVDFWTLLLNHNEDINEDLTQLNDYGTEINKLVEEVNNSFSKMQKYKKNDSEVITFYSDFLNDILNDKEKSDKYKQLLLENENNFQTNIDKEKNKTLDIESLLLDDQYNYIVISAKKEKFGIITNISLGICSIFGYLKYEIIGKRIELLIPNIYHKKHREILIERMKEFRKKIFSTQEQKIIYDKIYTFGKTKSKYLIQINLRPALFQTETDEIFFITKVWEDKCTFNSSSKNICFLITDNLLKIQYFTPNAISLLGVNSNMINSTIEITEYIKQFHEDVLKYIIEHQHQQHTLEDKMQLKRAILIKRYKNPVQINWKIPETMINKNSTLENLKMNEIKEYKNNYGYLRKSIPNIHVKKNNLSVRNMTATKKPKGLLINNFGSSLIKKNPNPNNYNNYSYGDLIYHDDLITLSVSIAKIKNSQEGFIFKFEKPQQKTNLGSSLVNSFIMSHRKRDDNQKGNYYNTNILIKEKSIDDSITPKDTENNFLNIFKVDKNYIPESKNFFQLDLKNMSFIVKNDDESIRTFLKEEAIKKLNYYNNDILEEEEEEEDEYEDEDSFGSSSNSKNFFFMKRQKSKVFVDNSLKPKNEDYYKVNMTNIKFLKYDYVKLIVQEVPDYKKISQMELKMSKKNDNQLFRQISNQNKKKNSKNDIRVKNIVKNDFTNFGNLKNQDSKINQKIIMKQIEYSLGKEETQPSIIKLRIISFIVVLLVLLIGFLILMKILDTHEIIKENIILSEYSFDLLLYNCKGVYYIRELILLNNENYTKFPSNNREEYALHLTNQTLNLFIKSHELITYMISSFFQITEKNNQYLSLETIRTFIIEDDYNIISYYMSLDNSFIESNSALFHIAHKNLNEIIPTNKVVFYYLYNSLNDLFIAYKKQTELYLDEIDYKIKDSKKQFLLVLFICLLIILLCYFLISFSYDQVAQRKESYLEFFFEIETHVIKNSLEKCVKFMKKINEESTNDNESTETFDNDILSSEKKQFNEIEKKNKEKGKRRIRKTYSSRETKVFKIIIAIFFFLVSIFCVLIFIFYLIWLNDSKIYLLYYQRVSELESRDIMLFNSLREYMFDENSKVNSTTSLEYTNKLLNIIYIIHNEYQRYIIEKRNTIPGGYKKIFEEILMSSPCKYSSYFSSETQCLNFMSKSPSFGLFVLISYLIEEIRILKDSSEKRYQIQHLTNFTFNLTLTGTEKGKSLYPQKLEDQIIYNELDSIQEFLIDDLHLNTNVMFIHLLIPFIQNLVDELRNCISKGVKNIKITYIIFICLYFSVIIAIYIFIWMPFQNNLSQIIFKTKNMLNIIPKEVLSELNNIHKLLD